MKFKVEKNRHTTILKILEKKIDHSISADLKAELIILSKPKSVKLFIIDFLNVEEIDEDGITALLIAQRITLEHDANLRLVNMSENVLSYFHSFKMIEQGFAIYKTLNEALEE